MDKIWTLYNTDESRYLTVAEMAALPIALSEEYATFVAETVSYLIATPWPHRPPPPVVNPPVNLIDRLPWNNDSPWPFPRRSLDSITMLTVHHSGGTDRDQTSIESWNAYHTRTKGWPHVGYHLGIGFYDKCMGLYQFNRLDHITWHDSKNTRSVGIVIAGDLRPDEDEYPTQEQADLFGQLMAWLIPQLPNLGYIISHKMVQSTACPGQIEVYGNMLIDAARTHDRDVTGMWLKQPSILQSLSLRRVVGPPKEAYEDV